MRDRILDDNSLIRQRTQRVIRVAVATFLCVIAAISGTWTVTTFLTQQSYPKDMRGNPVLLTPPPEAVQRKIAAVSALDGMRLRVPSTGLDVPIGALNEVDGVIDPPGFASAYLVRNYGATLANAPTGTVFVVMHSCRGGAVCPGNYLIDVAAGTASVAEGSDVYISGLHYRVTGSKKIYKPDVNTATDIWDNRPGRLVLVTCLQVPTGTESIDNMVVTAQLVK